VRCAPPELGEGPVIQLSARRQPLGELELRERSLGLAAEAAIDRTSVEALLMQLLLDRLVNSVYGPGDASRGALSGCASSGCREVSAPAAIALRGINSVALTPKNA